MSRTRTVAFIALAGAGGAYLAQRTTYVEADVAAADVLELLRPQGVTEVSCDDNVPIGTIGANLRCVARSATGTHTLDVALTADGAWRVQEILPAGPPR